MKGIKEDDQLRSVLEKDYNDIVNFKYCGDEYKKNTKIRDFLNNIFTANIKAVYTVNSKTNIDNGWDWSGEIVIIVNGKGKVIIMSNSEWSSIRLL
ncbi:hypothetical protein SEPL_477 [Salmonella phage SE_PL]|nr:hypothetical protein 7t3_074 [Salmonella phage 7t3]QIG63090.1 hypothetical protein SEPL_477 [Salmonella phage SE_PL]WNV47574.1 hypothetical protein [Klebsiella phage fENko-Kae01]